jgi:hypothetical protein
VCNFICAGSFSGSVCPAQSVLREWGQTPHWAGQAFFLPLRNCTLCEKNIIAHFGFGYQWFNVLKLHTRLFSRAGLCNFVAQNIAFLLNCY